MHVNYIFGDQKKHCLWPIGVDWGDIQWWSIENDFYHERCFVYSDREKNSASNESNFNNFKTDICDLLDQQLIFRSSKMVLDLPYYLTSFEKKHQNWNEFRGIQSDRLTFHGCVVIMDKKLLDVLLRARILLSIVIKKTVSNNNRWRSLS